MKSLYEHLDEAAKWFSETNGPQDMPFDFPDIGAFGDGGTHRLLDDYGITVQNDNKQLFVLGIIIGMKANRTYTSEAIKEKSEVEG